MAILLLKLCFLILLAELCIAQGCTPTNWNYAWTKVGKAWFTRIDTPRTWLKQIEQCKSIDPSRFSSIGTIRSKAEHSQVTTRFHGDLWTGAFEIGSTGQWYWWRSYGAPEKISQKFWASGEPNQYNGENEACIIYVRKGWHDVACSRISKALCEIRCN